ncbi:cyanidin 3-O-galactoside 2''-O-xylosyltransferase FGGT1-like [Humulus lupulus]|uniref:cyanidin 3-O-galactoside 2''-O-xylosyltransferase FGGT1-like n=1 Tax=Humulus lupulus TaxID=3486 RepID=UPI002B414CD8|nr:cyanidin 3-O-galactoside 2''-O-xylosyltransferase FGGT1-like [Humulus lupulus]
MEKSVSSLHIAMYPWFAFGHINPYIQLSNKLAQKGHIISFMIPPKTKSKVEHLNRYPDLITFYPITFPHVDGLPSGAESTNDVSSSSISLIMTAMDRTENDIELLLRQLKPHFIFLDFAYWIPKMAHRLGIKSMFYSVVTPAIIVYDLCPTAYHNLNGRQFTETDFMKPPPGYPDLSIYFHFHEAREYLCMRSFKLGGDMLFIDRLFISLSNCDVIGARTCREIDGPVADYLEKEFGKPLLLSGPLIPDPPSDPLDQKWVNFLGQFKHGSVIYCGFGSEVILTKDQLQELLLGLELSGLPFLAALRTPLEVDSIEEALPEGFKERIGGKGVVYGGWIQQTQILRHPSIGCFVTHCGWASLMEALVNKCELVLLSKRIDHFLCARLMGNTMKVGVEVEKGEEEGWLYARENVCKAIKIVMEEDNEVGKKVRANLAKLRQQIHREDFESSYIDDFSHNLKTLLA